ncbi:MAG: BrnT family toxin [Calditrichia bacterium]|nr:BrnT family toxin [Calditrichia bacterium]
MAFEFDVKKSELNKKKHGIDFNQAKNLWDDPEQIIIPARTTDEPRYLLIGKYNEKIWSAIFTIRNKNIRIISVRRSRNDEEKIYKS